MSMLDACWHALNFFAPAVGLGAFAALMAKLMWWRELRSVTLRSLATWAVAASSLALIVGLLWTGRDGKMLTYGAMVLGCSLALWWAGWRRQR